MSVEFLFPADLTARHREVIARYADDPMRLSAQDWPLLIAAFNLLRRAVVVVNVETSFTFARIYRQIVEERYAEHFINALYEMRNLPPESNILWAATARQVPNDLAKAGLYNPSQPDSHLLLFYCLYWWYAFAKGYAFEMEIIRDLMQSGLSVHFHDLRDRAARQSAFDVLIAGFKGDIKLSTYFLLETMIRAPNADFYITRLWRPRQRERTLVVFLRNLTWQQIDGETLFAALAQLDALLPQPVRIAHRGGELVVVEYALWKDKMVLYQRKQEAKS